MGEELTLPAVPREALACTLSCYGLRVSGGLAGWD